MRHRVHVSPFRLPASVLLLALLPTGAMATPGVIVDEGASSGPSTLEAVNGACTLANGPISNLSLGWPAPDYLTAIASAIDPAACSACPSPQLLTLNSVSFRLRWLGACNATAEVSIIGATGSPGCLTPDPSQVLCPPVTHTISSPGSVGVVHTLPMPSGCCISGPAFVLVRFIGLDQCLSTGSGPYVTNTTLPCSSCQSWWSWAIAAPTLSDQCVVPGTVSSQSWVSVDADCCAPTPSLPKSWGGVKTLYR